MSAKKHLALPALLKQITECLKAVSGDDSTQGSEAETVASRMQSLLLVLVENYTKSSKMRDRELQAVMKLMNLAMQRLPAAFTGSSGKPILTMLANLLPLLADVGLKSVHSALLQTVSALLSLSALHCFKAYKAGLQDVLDLLEDSCTSLKAVHLAAQVPAQWHVGITTFHNSAAYLQHTQTETESVSQGKSPPRMELVLTSVWQIQMLIANLIQIVDHCVMTTPAIAQMVLPHPFTMETVELVAHAGFTVQAAAIGLLSSLMRMNPLPLSQLMAANHAVCQNLRMWITQSPFGADCVSQWQDNLISCSRLLMAQLPGDKTAELLTQLFRAAVRSPAHPKFQSGLYQLVCSECCRSPVDLQQWIDACKDSEIAIQQATADGISRVSLDDRALMCVAKALAHQIGAQNLSSLTEILDSGAKTSSEAIDLEASPTRTPPAKRAKTSPQESFIDLEASPLQDPINLASQKSAPPQSLQQARTAKGTAISLAHTSIAKQMLALVEDSVLNPIQPQSPQERLQRLRSSICGVTFFIPQFLTRLAPAVGEWVIWSLSPVGSMDSRLDTITLVLECVDGFFSALVRYDTEMNSAAEHNSDACTKMALAMSVSKEQLKSFTLIPFTAGLGLDSSMSMTQTQSPQPADSPSLARAQVLALRIYGTAVYFNVADNHNSFAKGSIGYKAEKCKAAAVLGARAILIPVIVQNSPRPSRLLQSAVNSIIRLAEAEETAVKEAALSGSQALLVQRNSKVERLQATIQALKETSQLLLAGTQNQHLNNDDKAPGQTSVIVAPGYQSVFLDASQAAKLLATRCVPEVSSGVTIADLQRILDLTLWSTNPVETLQVKALGMVGMWTSMAHTEELTAPFPVLLRKCLQMASSSSPALRNAVLKLTGPFTRPEVIRAMNSDQTANSQSQSAGQILSRAEAKLLQVFRELSLQDQPEAVIISLLQSIAVYGSHMHGEKAELLVVCVLLGRIDDTNLAVRAIAAELLIKYAKDKQVDLRILLLGAPKVLQLLGRNIGTNPNLIEEVAELLFMDPKEIAQKVLIASIPFLAETKNEEALKALSSLIGTDLKTLVHDFGYYAVAQFMFAGKTDLAAFMEFMERLLDQNFITYLSDTMPHVILEMFRIAGSSESWKQEVTAPTEVLDRLEYLLKELSRIQRGPSDAASFLADSDNATRLLKACGDALERFSRQEASTESSRPMTDVRSQQEVVRGVVLLIHLIHPHAARYTPQIMVLLSTSMGRRKPVEVKLQALEGWRVLVKSLANTPSHLSSIINQVVVTLLDSLQEGGQLTAPATRVLEDIVINHKSCLTAEIKALPLLPSALSKVNDVITHERGKLTSSEQINLLLRSLQDDSLSVRTTALQELRDFLNQHRQFLATLLAGSSNAARQSSHAPQGVLLSNLVGALLRCCDAEIHSPLALKAHLLCAECLGLIGAVDPARLDYQPSPTKALLTNADDLVIQLISQHLVKLLRVADSLMTLEAAVYALQEILKNFGNEEVTDDVKDLRRSPQTSNTMFIQLPEDVRTLVKPYLDSRFVLEVHNVMPPVVVFTASGSSFRRWLYSWLRTLIENYAHGDLEKLFKACTLVLRHDVQTCQFLMPYVIQNVIKTDRAALELVKQEIETVLNAGHSSKEGELCIQAVFTLLDMLKGFVVDLKNQAARDEAAARLSGISSPAEAEEQTQHITDLLNSIPMDLLAQAAYRCNAHARALQYYETYVRKIQKGAHNPAALKNAAFTDEEITFLQEIYGKLEEPDGLSGLMRLRHGGLSLPDQILAAEKTGSWTEAAALYEQALKQGYHHNGEKTVGLSTAQYGHLQCLLQMGHLQGMMAEVDGWSNRADDLARAQLAAVGTAGAWRLGTWDLLTQYLQPAHNHRESLSTDELWELRIGKLLLSVSNRERVETTNALQEARLAAMAPLIAASTESYTRAYPYLVKLHMLQELADAAVLLQEASLAGPLERQRRLRWEERLNITQSSLPVQEPILALRRQLAVLSGAEKEAALCWLQQAKVCRATGHFEAACTAGLEALAREVPGAVIEHSKLLWDTDQPYRAIARLQQEQQSMMAHQQATQLSPNQKLEMAHSKTQILLQLARWVAQTGQGAASDITGLFKQAIALEPKSEKAFFHYATFLDQLMQDAKTRQSSHVSSSSKHMDRMGGKSKIQVGEDKPFVEYISDIIYNYGKAVQCGHRNVYQALPRMLTVYFDFGSHYLKLTKPSRQEKQALADVQHTMQRLSKDVPLYLWLVSLPQLTSRICHPHQATQDLTQNIITRLTAAFPQQALWALAQVTKSKVTARSHAANSILRVARKQQAHDEELKQLHQQFPAFCDQLIRLCHHNPGDRVKTMSARSDVSPLIRMMPLAVLVPTTTTLQLVLPPGGATEKDHQPFTNAVTIERLRDKIDVMTSLMKPKKVIFVGSDGKEYPFLLKPDDDLRKDTRLMETAGLLNRLFAREPLSRRRNLYIRRFAVTPLTESCGLIEWVNYTTGLRQCCTAVYKMARILTSQSNPTIKNMYDSYKGRRMSDLMNKVLKMFPPLMHNFFLSTFTEPAAWLNARLAFTRTTAVWCMVGHMLGLGDRHGENILMDTSTGDCINIDFACLFDKGLTLAKPEMVPFRLTQNVIDGFGVAGYEGVFRKVSEITLRVLRDHRDALANVLETFVHDPLVDWTGHGPSNQDDGTENLQARDAMATIQGRLTGTLLGVRSIPSLPLSVEGQVHRLIEEATDKENLGSMYIWWMAWF